MQDKKKMIATYGWLRLLPLIHVSLPVFAFWVFPNGLGIGLGILAFYFIPPFIGRLTKIQSVDRGIFGPNSKEYWLLISNLVSQNIFNRFPIFEEILRLIPGLYSIWLRLWGSCVGANVIYHARVEIVDGSYVNIGDNVMFGNGAVIGSHAMYLDREGNYNFALRTSYVETGTIVAGRSLYMGMDIEKNRKFKAGSTSIFSLKELKAKDSSLTENAPSIDLGRLQGS